MTRTALILALSVAILAGTLAGWILRPDHAQLDDLARQVAHLHAELNELRELVVVDYEGRERRVDTLLLQTIDWCRGNFHRLWRLEEDLSYVDLAALVAAHPAD